MNPETMIVISHHDDRKVDLLRECVLPRLAGRAGCYVERHWLRGPHLRVIGDDAAVADLERTLAPAAVSYLERRPSTTVLDGDRYLRISERLGEAELIMPPYGPLRPDNAVSVEPYPADQAAALLGDTGARLKHDWFAGSVRPLGLACSAVASGTHRIALAFGAMALHAARWPLAGGIAYGQLSYRSHLEDWFANQDAGDTLRRRIAADFDRRADTLRALLRDVLDHSEHGVYDGPSAYLRAWSAAFDRIWPAALAAGGDRTIGADLGDGYLERARGFGDATVEARWRFGPDRPASEFHRTLATQNYLPEWAAVTEFAAYRFLTNQLTRWLPLIDIAPVERYFVSYAISELVEQELGVSWRDQLSVGPS